MWEGAEVSHNKVFVAAARNGSSAAKTSVRARRQSTDEREHPFV